MTAVSFNANNFIKIPVPGAASAPVGQQVANAVAFAGTGANKQFTPRAANSGSDGFFRSSGNTPAARQESQYTSLFLGRRDNA